ncbi:hypothetical protein LTR37_014969 [Vermiconidia calcicola]|uniref:Uncharacterized protein n=1 Tax=Vermiconidia calcicola TaxID=1690605 RepID=A0ACC3MTE9_9PEZI|nr:hypothetical protein LTR37_014969 [Vermiconidia calcicola]
MAPSVVEDAVQSNEPPSMHTAPSDNSALPNITTGPSSGVFTPSQADGQWTPASVLETLPHQPELHSISPLPFLHLLERLKTTKREGWRRFGINHGESISDHMYRMSIITLLCPPTLSSRIDIARCTKMALIHDMAELLVGDITPIDGVTKSEKSRRETETMDYLCSGLLSNVHSGIPAKHMREIWQEYEDSETLESKFVHDVDKMELLLQMMEYERSYQGRMDLGEFSRVAKRIVLPEVQEWAAELLVEREGFWATFGKLPSGVLVISEERRRQQDEYYGGDGNGHANGSVKE